MKITISPKWFKQHGKSEERVEADLVTAYYYGSGRVSLRFWQPAENGDPLQAKLSADMTPQVARQLAAELIRHDTCDKYANPPAPVGLNQREEMQ